jgi:glycosyltransferase involved in cell wall biosynthesis
MKVAVLTCGVPFIRGGAERHADDLCGALRAAGHEAELIALPFKHYPARSILDHMLAFRLLDLTETCGAAIDRVIALKFPAYLTPHPNKVVWMCHQHRTAYELWDHPLAGDLIHERDGPLVREAIRRADTDLLPEARAIYTTSHNVSGRLRRYCDIDSTPLYHPPRDEGAFYSAPARDYLFFPSRINLVKRQKLVIEALARCRERVRVCFAGEPDQPGLLQECRKAAEKSHVESRIEWLGAVSEAHKRELYAGSIGVIFPPIDEDYGYITLEAMLSSKPVITCTDSGGPLEFVVPGETGLVAEPEPRSLAAAMDRLWSLRQEAARMGAAARERYAALKISWKSALERLLS